MSAEIVIAGAVTRETLPLAREFPVHFRKTYYPGRLHGDPAVEFARHTEASALIDVPPPIGFGESVFRACLLPGIHFQALSPFQSDQEEFDLRQARTLPLPAAAGLWKLSEAAFELLQALHRGGLAHGDAVLQNFIVCPSPLEILPIDFETSVRKDALSEDEWKQRLEADLAPLLTHTVFLLCALGPQRGALAEHAMERVDRLLRDPERVRREIERRSELDG